MKMNLSNKMFFAITMVSVIASMSSNNMLFTWMSMEINLISFVPLMKKSKKMNDQAMKYLIIQSMSSSMILMSMMSNSAIDYPFDESMMMLTGLMIKLGMMPFHLWMPTTMQMMEWKICMMMITLQKVTPVIISSQLLSMNIMMMPMAMSMMISPIAGMNQSSVKKIMAYSSISNTPLMIMALTTSKELFLWFFSMYSMINLSMMKMMMKINMNFINQMSDKTIMQKMSMMTGMLSMSGMPPTTGFMMKWMIVKALTEATMLMPIMIIVSSIMSTLVYMNMMIPLMTKSIKKSLKINETLSMGTMIMNLMGMPAMMTMLMN